MDHVDRIMAKMGFPPGDAGRYVSALRHKVEGQVRDHGLRSMSYGTWACPDLSNEERARAILATEWALEHGHSCEQKCIDGFPLRWRLNVKTMRWRLEFKPSRLSPWFGDQWRRFKMEMRIFRDWLMRVRNPYSR